MLKTLLRFLVVAVIAVALGLLIYHLNQPTSASLASNFTSFGRDFGEHGLQEGGFSVARGLFGVAGNLLLVGIVTVAAVFLQKVFAYKAEPARLR